jgi:ABC-type polysaccharide/polyol phosphate export permease
MSLFTAGVALALSAANIFYHDVNYLWGVLVQVLFYATPVIYSPAQVQLEALRIIANFGPTGSFIIAFHNVLYDLRMPGLGRWIHLVIVAFGTFFVGAWIFNRLSPRFAEEM